MNARSTPSQSYNAWADIAVYREIGGEIIGKTVSVCAKVYDGEIEFFYKTEGCDQLTPAEWDNAERMILEDK